MATIRIFTKGLKNAHSLSTHIYENGLQTLNDAISEVEKLSVIQQLTATITPPSMVNMMTNNDDRCVQCQEHGHIARHCPSIRYFECDEYSYVVMKYPHKIPPLWNPSKASPIQTTQRSPCLIKFQILLWRQGQVKTLKVSAMFSQTPQLKLSRIPIEVILDHNIGILAIITGVAHNAWILHTGIIAIDLTMTLHMDHTTDHLHTRGHHTTPEIEACCKVKSILQIPTMNLT